MRKEQPKFKQLPPVDSLNSLFYYDGFKLYWRKTNKPAGSLTDMGYLKVRIDNKLYYVHRVIWKVYHGYDPIYEIDHINGVKHDNSIDNLRDVPKVVNMRNNNAKGYTYCKKTNKYISQIKVKDKVIHIGVFNTKEEAETSFKDVKDFLNSFKGYE